MLQGYGRGVALSSVETLLLNKGGADMLSCPKCGADCSVLQCGDPYTLPMTKKADDGREFAIKRCNYGATCPNCGCLPEFFIQYEEQL
jgi:hypothetical protein